MILFWAIFHRYEKWSKSSKVTPDSGVEIENVTFCIFNIFNFGSSTRWHFSTLTSLFSSIQIFDTSWLDKNIRQNVKNRCLWASCISGTLKRDVCNSTQRKKGYQNGAPGELLLQMVPFFHGGTFFP